MTNIIQLQQSKIKIQPNLIRIGAVIQARMTSKRFPGKSMAPLLGKPVIQWTMERAKKILGPKKVKVIPILAVPDTKESEPMLALAQELEVENYCGSETNVLRRYYEAGIFHKLDIIIRITGDCPFIDPIVCSEVLKVLLWRKLDYCSNVFPVRTYPKGLDCEVFTMDCLDAAFKLSDQLYDYEHVTPWMQRTGEVKKGNVKQKIDASHLNYCVDLPEDIQRIEEMIKQDAKVLIGANDA